LRDNSSSKLDYIVYHDRTESEKLRCRVSEILQSKEWLTDTPRDEEIVRKNVKRQNRFYLPFCRDSRFTPSELVILRKSEIQKIDVNIYTIRPSSNTSFLWNLVCGHRTSFFDYLDQRGSGYS